jgi:hypothetical protein
VKPPVPDAMSEILEAIGLLHGVDRALGRSNLEAIWARISHAPKAIDECVLAHYLADVQEHLADELNWDIRALNAAMRSTDSEARACHPTLSISALLPSLHLNLAEDYWKLGDFDSSRSHVDRARDSLCNLADDGYGRMVRSGVQRLGERLAGMGMV